MLATLRISYVLRILPLRHDRYSFVAKRLPEEGKIPNSFDWLNAWAFGMNHKKLRTRFDTGDGGCLVSTVFTGGDMFAPTDLNELYVDFIEG
jgi:hypothetical protein